MEVRDLDSLEDFKKEVEKLTQKEAKRRKSGKYTSGYVYRGQSNKNWILMTSLERFKGLLTMEEYYKAVYTTKTKVETFTDKKWGSIPTPSEYLNELGDEGLLRNGVFPAYDYLVYLRHHGFPSPLLDWTQSPNIAGYFAFRNVSSKSDYVSIYAYCEYTKGIKVGSSSRPKIIGLGPNVSSHKRHFLQKCEYTICTMPFEGKHKYANHEDAFAEQRDDQDELWKFNIPVTERIKVLKKLEQYNIDAYELFESKESLMEALSFKEILFRA